MTGSVATTSGVTESNESLVLTLTGKCLDVSGLVNKKKFRFRGGKEGALKAMKQLEESELGKVIINKSKGSVKVCSYIQLANNVSLLLFQYTP